ncbi:putative nucleotidyltransferase substrate binding domain-containing protein [Limisalsivibrio acetivorans]|uniref:putative nucleotidyltransferase substrate binding domain-containing protein n=1 Tax=Limisalsivibrio acetivorans TaxID=1304888 RepID=UPI0003B34AA0|nr:putative nucleotidyltransferase substrate binding domain-containing protein [Limisalsivibrio acetivorans]
MLNKEIIDLLQNFFLFRGVDLERLEMVTGNSQLIALESGDVIFHKNEAYQKGLYMLAEGKVSLAADYEHGEVTLSPGDFIGLSTFLAKSRYTVTAKCVDDSTLIFFPEVCIYKLMSDYEDFKEKLQQLIIDRLNNLSGHKTDSILHSTYKSVGTYMTSPVMKVNCSTTIVDACQVMSNHRIGSLVAVDDRNKIAGILTSKNVIHKFFNNFEESLNRPELERYVNDDPVAVPPEFPLVSTLHEMRKKNQDYAVAVKNDEPIGIISSKDILRILFSDSSIYATSIDEAESVDDLRENFRSLYRTAESLMNSSKMTSEILPIISSMHINIMKKLYDVTAEQFLEKTGKDIRTIKHAIIVMGSAARKEAMLDPDQDNGYVFPDSISEEDRASLNEFAVHFSDNLDYVGYEYCKGGIMVTNEEMANTLSEWKELIGDWIDNPGEKGIRWSSIIFDLTTLVGEDRLVWELRQFILDKISKKPAFLLQMLQSDAGLKIPRSIFGKFIVEKEGEHKGMINLKRAALSFIVDVTRAFSLFKGQQDLNTIERMEHLARAHVLSEETHDNIQNAYEVVTDILLSNQIEMAKEGKQPDKFVDPHKLSLYNQEKLKNALSQISKFLSTGLRYFSGSPF